ncbi:hypothetical protein HaLaN_22479 [Haematococcus lacustris]|uniref:Uncharacterized protein n=1 Tax=Haematococcus lacustris TaxID=44745 RepID=A0A6A0A106_HAELA|nr:hypothetical protein HaLaN_22479 [Haematococcus lacustris]
MKEEHAELRRDIEELDRGVGGGDMTARVAWLQQGLN